MSLKLNTASGGSISLQEADTASNLTITVPANSGTMLTTASTFAGTGPAFSAYRDTSQTVSNNTTTKVQLVSEDFDTASCFDPVTNYRFTPNIAGYYLFTFGIYGISSGNSMELNFPQLYKNGAAVSPSTARAGSYTYTPGNPYYDGTSSGSVFLYMNGSTDYVELYGRLVGSGTLNFREASLQGFLARAA